jgi:sigma-B regulation protein RsbU (phosphoserine phosphatase)
VEELALEGVPLGSPIPFDYQECRVELENGDTLLLMTDGLPELQDSTGEPFGYPRVRDVFQKNAGRSPDELIEALTHAAEEWTDGEAPGDDVTFVVVKAISS